MTKKKWVKEVLVYSFVGLIWVWAFQVDVFIIRLAMVCSGLIPFSYLWQYVLAKRENDKE